MAKAKTTDDAVMELLVEVERKKEAVAARKKKPQWKTNLSISRDSTTTHGRVNIMTRNDPNEIVDWYVFLIQREEYTKKAAKELNLPAELTWLGYPISDWKDDLKTRAAQLSIDQKQKEIDELNIRVNKLVSPDQRRDMELEAIQKLLREKR